MLWSKHSKALSATTARNEDIFFRRQFFVKILLRALLTLIQKCVNYIYSESKMFLACASRKMQLRRFTGTNLVLGKKLRSSANRWFALMKLLHFFKF